MYRGFMNTAVYKIRSLRKAEYLSVNLFPFPKPLIRPLWWDKRLEITGLETETLSAYTQACQARMDMVLICSARQSSSQC